MNKITAADDEATSSDMVIDASLNRYCWLLTFPVLHCGFFCPYSTVLTLRKEEVIRHDVTLCGERVSVRPYGDLGSVETGFCCCFVCIDSNLGTLMPSFGCDRDATNFIVHELNARMASRGDAAQIQMAKDVVARTSEINEKMELITKHLTDKNIDLSTSPTSFTIDER
jgi:hypothetical protein